MNPHPRFLDEARARESRLVASAERLVQDSITGEESVLRQEWRVRLMGDPGLSHDELRAVIHPSCDVGENVLEKRFIRGGVEGPWTVHDSSDRLDEVLGMIPAEAAAFCPRLCELRGLAAEAERAREKQAAAERSEREASRERLARAGRFRATFARMLAGSDANRVLAGRWEAHVEAFRKAAWEGEAPPLARLLSDPEFRETGDAVYDSRTVPAAAKAMRSHLARWESLVGTASAGTGSSLAQP